MKLAILMTMIFSASVIAGPSRPANKTERNLFCTQANKALAKVNADNTVDMEECKSFYNSIHSEEIRKNERLISGGIPLLSPEGSSVGESKGSLKIKDGKISRDFRWEKFL